jgi:CheY-like chemotaxis protein
MKKKILVVDDDPVQRDLYLEIFRNKGFDVISGNDGLEGLDKTLKEKPDLVFTGIIMPRMDGFEFIKNLRANVATAKLPVIMFSHLGRQEDQDKANKLSNVIFMVKGVDGPAVILKKVEELIDGSEKV